MNRRVPEGRVGIAVSGGPDSLGLLLAAAETFPGEVEAATVDHGLRPQGAAEAAMVAGVCAGLGVPHKTLTVTVAAGASQQAHAREARYAALGTWAQARGLASVLTAHHADDQAETLLMRLARGSGIRGLSGIREERPLAIGVLLLRPLLGIPKSFLEEVVAAAGLVPVDDPANRDPRHERSRARALIDSTPWLDPLRLARSAAALAEAEEVLRDGFAEIMGENIQPDPDARGLTLRPYPLNRLYRRWLLEAGLQLLGGRDVSGPELDRLLATLAKGGSATLRGIKIDATGPPGQWRLEPAPPRRRS